jgi:hypothetical protein
MPKVILNRWNQVNCETCSNSQHCDNFIFEHQPPYRDCKNYLVKPEYKDRLELDNNAE